MALLDLACLVLDCGDPSTVARFYEAAGAGEVTELDDTGGYVTFGSMLLAIRKVEDYQPPSWPSSDVPMQMHMDFNVDDLGEAETLLRAYGATTPEYQPHRAHGLIVMLDPAGHPFCIGRRPMAADTST